MVGGKACRWNLHFCLLSNPREWQKLDSSGDVSLKGRVLLTQRRVCASYCSSPPLSAVTKKKAFSNPKCCSYWKARLCVQGKALSVCSKPCCRGFTACRSVFLSLSSDTLSHYAAIKQCQLLPWHLSIVYFKLRRKGYLLTECS